jgi:hypothetical protein
MHITAEKVADKDEIESSTPTKIKLSHQGEIKLVSSWGTTLSTKNE